MKLNDLNKQSLLFIYDVVYADYCKAKRKRDKYKKERIILYKKHLINFQKIINSIIDDFCFTEL